MKTRVISAAVLIVLVVGCFVISPLTRLLLMLTAAVLAIWETCRALSSDGTKCAVWVAYILAAAAASFFWFGLDRIYTDALFFLAVFAVACCGVISPAVGAKGALGTLAVLVYPTVPFLIIIQLSLLSNNICIPVFVLGCVSTWLCDAFALFGGKRFGKHKLAPLVSPNKTVEGSVCGALASVAGGVLVWLCLKSFFGIGLIPCAVTALIASTFGQFGDLAASLIKRMCGIKDYSKLIPGHGGVMDRVDSLLFAIPVTYFTLTLWGIL